MNIKKIINKLSLRRNKEIKKIEEKFVQMFIDGWETASTGSEKSYTDLMMYYSYFKNDTRLKPIIKSVKLRGCFDAGGFEVTFNQYDLDLEGLNKLLEKEEK